MYERNARQGYSAYLKAAYATVFTISTFLLAKSTGYFFGSLDISEDSKVDEDINIEKNSLDLRRSIEQDTNQTMNQETPQSLQLVNSTPAGSFKVSGIQDMIIQDNIAYLAIGNDGFQVVDISNISNPIIAGSYQATGFAHQLNIVGNYVYLAYDLAGLRILDISHLSNISLVGIFLTGNIPQIVPVTKVAVVGSKALIIDATNAQSEWVDVSQPTEVFRVYFNTPTGAFGVDVVGGIAYVADDTSGLQVFDVSNFDLLCSFNMPGKPQKIAVIGSIGYIANGGAGLQLVNVSNSSNPSLLGGLATSDSASAINVVGSIAYVADHQAGLLIFDVSNPNNISFLSNLSVSYAQGVVVVDNIAYVATNYLQLINVSNPSYPSLLGNFSIAYAQSLAVVAGIAYVTDYNHGLQIIDVSNPTNLSLLGNIDTPGFAFDVSVVGSIAYVATFGSGLQLINVSNPGNPSLLNNFKIPGDLYGVSVVNNIAYVAGSEGLQLINVTPGAFSYDGIYILENKFINDVFTLGDTLFYTEQSKGLALIDNQNFRAGAISIPGFAYGVSVVGSIAYVADFTAGGLQLVNVSDPSNPVLLTNFNTSGGYAYSVTVVDNIAYLISGGLLLINVSNPNNLSLLGRFDELGAFYDVSVVADIAYVAVELNSLLVINVSNPSNPSSLGKCCNFLDSAVSVSVVGSIAYVVEAITLHIIDVSSPSNLNLLGSFPISLGLSVDVVGSVAYVVVEGGLQLIDVSDSINPSFLSNFNILGITYIAIDAVADISVVGSIAYVAVNSADLQLFNVSDPTTIQLIRSYNTPGNALGIDISGGFAYVADNDAGLQIFNLDLEKGIFPTLQIASQITAQNNTAYLSDNNKTLYLLDITNTSNPTEISRYILSSQATDMLVSELQDGNNKYMYLYVAESLDGIEVVDVTNSSFPIYAGSITEGIINARTLQINGNTLYVNNNNTEVLAFNINVLHYLNVSTNNLILSQGTTTITEAQLNVIAINPFDVATGDTDAITYNVNNVQQGQFVFNQVGVTSFTQAQINNQAIQFIYTGNGAAPSFGFNVANEKITAGTYVANIDFIIVPLPPVIHQNNIVCNEGEIVGVTSNNIYATNADGTTNPNLIFLVNEMSNSQFEFNSTPGIIVTQFTQQNIIDNIIRFVQIDGADTNNINDILPFYQLVATNGVNQSGVSNATIDFDATPKIIQNQISIGKGESVIITQANLNATDIDNNLIGNLTFQISNTTNGQFVLTNNANIILSNFTQQQISNQQITFTQDGSDNSPNYLVSVTDGRATSPISSPTVSFNNKQASLNAGLIAGGVVGGIAGLAALVAGGGFFAKTYRDAATREPHPFANAVHAHLKLNGMDNFKTEQGRKFVRLMEEDMTQALLPYGLDIQNMRPKALDDLAKNIAIEAKNKITGRTTTFGYSEIQLDQLESKINDIAQAVSQHKDKDQIRNSTLENGDDNYDNYYLLKDDDVNIPLKPFVPSFSLRANNFESV